MRQACERRDGASVEFVVGDATDLPVPDASFDVAASVFGVMFARDAGRAAAELIRGLRGGGRIALTSWRPEGPISIAGRLVFEALGASPSPKRWGDEGWVRDVLTGAGAREVAVAEHGLAFTATSPEAWFADQEEHHPVWRWARRQLDDARWARVRAESVTALTEANEDAGALRTTSRYLVVTARAADVAR